MIDHQYITNMLTVLYLTTDKNYNCTNLNNKNLGICLLFLFVFVFIFVYFIHESITIE